MQYLLVRQGGGFAAVPREASAGLRRFVARAVGGSGPGTIGERFIGSIVESSVSRAPA